MASPLHPTSTPPLHPTSTRMLQPTSTPPLHPTSTHSSQEPACTGNQVTANALLCKGWRWSYRVEEVLPGGGGPTWWTRSYLLHISLVFGLNIPC